MSATNIFSAPAPASDFSFALDETLGSLGGAASRFAHNVTAIKLLKELEAENRPAGALAGDEQRILSHYSGWGDTEVLNQAFPRGAYSWAEPCDVNSLSLLKPGGILAFITSRYTLDKKKSVVRRHLAQQAELLAAVRLPGDAFKRNAGTEVITDVIILRKRATPISVNETSLPVWVETEMLRLRDEHGAEADMPVNRLFATNPDLALGEMKLGRGMYARADLDVVATHNDLAKALRENSWSLRRDQSSAHDARP